MKKSIFKKIGGLFLGLAMGLGVAVGVTAGNKAGEVKAATTFGTATIKFGTNDWKPTSTDSTKTDSLGQTWTLKFGGSTSVTNNASYMQYGSSSKPISSLSLITAGFSRDVTLTKFYLKYGGSGSGAASKASLKAGDEVLKTGEGISGATDEEITWTGSKPLSQTTKLGISFSGLAKGTKLYSFSYTISEATAASPQFTVVLKSGDGTGEDISRKEAIDQAFEVPSLPDTYSAPTDKVFDCWSGSNGVTYDPKDSIEALTFTENYTFVLTALWKDIPGMPTDLTRIAELGSDTFYNSDESQEITDGLKYGTRDTGGSVSVTVPAGADTLVLFGAGWKGSTVTASSSSSCVDSISGSFSSDDGMSATGPYYITAQTLYDDSFKITAKLKDVTSEQTITLNFSGRGGVWYAGYKLGNVKTLKSIAVTTNPTKTSYNAGEYFQTNGMVVKATYGNSQGSDTTETITGYTCNPSTSTALTSSNDKVTISYTEGGVTKTTEVAIDVAYFDGIKITTAASKTSYHDGEKFDVSGLVVKAVTKHSSGIADDEVDVTSSVTYKIGTSAATPGSTEVKKGDNQTVTISYNGKTATYAINCGYAYVTGIEFGVAPETMGPGDTYSPTATVSPLTAEQGKTFTVKSQTEGVLVEFNGDTLKISDGTAAGSVTLLVTSTGKKENGEFATNEVTIAVSAAAIPQLTGFAITGTATKATQYLNDTFELDLSGLTITGTYDIENPNPETFGIEDFLWDTDSYDYPYGIYLLNDNLDISLEGCIELVEDFCETIDFVTEDITNKTYYTTDESFDHTGLSISGKMASGADAVIDTSKVEYIFSTTPAELGAGTEKSVSVYAKYGDAETDSITISGIEVKEIVLESISVTSQPSKLTYTIGESFSSNGIVVEGTNNDGSDAGEVTSECSFEYDETAFLKAGTPTITVKHSSGKTTSFTVTVVAEEISSNWVKMTTADFEDDGKYLIVDVEDAGAMIASNENGTGNSTTTNGNYSSKEFNTNTNLTHYFTFEATTDGYYIKDGATYVRASGTTNNGLGSVESLTTENEGIWTVTGSNGTFTLISKSSRQLSYYGSNWRSYGLSSSSKTDVHIYKQVQNGTISLAGITATYNHTGDTYYTGDDVVSADFTVKAWYNNGDTVNNVSGFTITNSTLDEGDNTIELSYEGKKCTVLVSGIETRSATVDHVYVETETDYQVNYYLDGATAAWNLEKINVVAYWTDGTTNTSSLSDLVESGDVTLSKAAPEVGDTSFTVSGSYYGTAIDSAHNSITVSVVAKAVTKLTWTIGSNFNFKVFEGTKLDTANLGSVTAEWNDDSKENSLSVATLLEEGKISMGLWKTYSTTSDPDVVIDSDFVWSTDYEGYRIAFNYGGKRTSKQNTFHVVETLNSILVGNGESDIINVSDLSSLPTSKDRTTNKVDKWTGSVNGLQLETKNVYKNDSDFSFSWKANQNDDDEIYLKNTQPCATAISNIEITIPSFGSYLEVYGSSDGSSWTKVNSKTESTKYIYDFSDYSFNYFKLADVGYSSSRASNGYINFQEFTINYKGDIANTDVNTQDSVIIFAQYFYEELNEVCNSFDTTSDAFKEAWSNVASKYNEMFGSSSTIEGLDKTLAANMFKYAYPNGRVGEEADVLQLAMQRYDTIVARDTSLSNFITRASSYNAPRVNNPITNLSNVDNSVWVISAVALVGLTAIGGYFFYRKRKEI